MAHLHQARPSESWWCPTGCGRQNGKGSMFCGECGHQWTPSTWTSYGGASGSNGWLGPYYANWGWNSEQPQKKQKKQRKEPKSPRPKKEAKSPRRPSRHRPPQDGKPANGPKPPPPPMVPMSETPWKGTPPPQAPLPAPLPPEAVAAQQTLQNMLNLLRRHGEQLPEEVKATLKDMTVKDGKQQTKDLHQAVTQLGLARKELEAAMGEREGLHMAWQSYVHDAVMRWDGYTKDFAEQDAKISDRIQKAQETLAIARTNFAEQKQGAGVPCVDLEEDEDDELEPVKDNHIIEQLGMMNDALKVLKNKATEMYEEHVQKKQKLQDSKQSAPSFGHGPIASGTPGGGTSFPSQQPFGQAGS
eukprot:Skav217567  [mRNA]  locus=scaffold1602:700819:701892:+ [translate_table: standard]